MPYISSLFACSKKFNSASAGLWPCKEESPLLQYSHEDDFKQGIAQKIISFELSKSKDIYCASRCSLIVTGDHYKEIIT